MLNLGSMFHSSPESSSTVWTGILSNWDFYSQHVSVILGFDHLGIIKASTILIVKLLQWISSPQLLMLSLFLFTVSLWFLQFSFWENSHPNIFMSDKSFTDSRWNKTLSTDSVIKSRRSNQININDPVLTLQIVDSDSSLGEKMVTLTRCLCLLLLFLLLLLLQQLHDNRSPK